MVRGNHPPVVVEKPVQEGEVRIFMPVEKARVVSDLPSDLGQSVDLRLLQVRRRRSLGFGLS